MLKRVLFLVEMWDIITVHFLGKFLLLFAIGFVMIEVTFLYLLLIKTRLDMRVYQLRISRLFLEAISLIL